MSHEDLISAFAKRTLANLDLVKRAADEGHPDAFEVTQLWNSLLGLIVAPRERDVRGLPKITLAKLRTDGWPDITTAGKLQSETLRGLVGTLRNTVAHFNVEFLEVAGEIQGVFLWNEQMDDDGHPLPDHPHCWEGRLTIGQLEKLARSIGRMYIEHVGFNTTGSTESDAVAVSKTAGSESAG